MASIFIRDFEVRGEDSGSSSSEESARSAERVSSGRGASSSTASSSSGRELSFSASSSSSGREASSSTSPSSLGYKAPLEGRDEVPLVGRDEVPLVRRSEEEFLDDDKLVYANIRFEMGVEDLKRMRKGCGLGDLEVVLPDHRWRAHQPPVGYMTLYEEYFKLGLQLPISGIFDSILDYFSLALGQLTPNALVVTLNFEIACEKLKIPPTLELFLYLFTFRPAGKGYVALYAAKGVEYQKDGKKVPSHGMWKEKFSMLVIRMWIKTVGGVISQVLGSRDLATTFLRGMV